MTLGKLINLLQQAEMVLGSDAEVIILQDNWWTCWSDTSIREVVLRHGTLQVGLSVTSLPAKKPCI